MYSTKRTRSYKERKAIAGIRARRIVLIIFLFIFYQFFSIYISTPLKIETRSMEPTLFSSDRILFSKVYQEIRGVQRGDVLVVHPPYYRENQQILDVINPFVRFFTFQKIQLSAYSRQEWEIPYMIKRVIGLPGDTIRIENYRAYVIPSDGSGMFQEFDLITTGYSLNDPDLPDGWEEGMPLDGCLDSVTLGEGEYFVLGDSRGMGNDSLIWGALNENQIVGTVFFRYFPLSRMTPFI